MAKDTRSRDKYEPVSGADAMDAWGPKTLSGFETPQEPVAAPPRIRAISELTYGPSTKDRSAAPAGAPVNRVAVSDTTRYSWSANAALLVTVPGHSDPFLATGWFIGPYAVMTAAHVVFPWEPGGHMGWATQIEVIPGLNGFGSQPPFGKSTTNSYFCPNIWQAKGKEKPESDYGVVLLNVPVGDTVGTYGFAIYESNELFLAVANLSGYPDSSPDGSEPQGRQWHSSSSMVNVENSFIYYDVGAQFGDSGSCVYRQIGHETFAMAIHSASKGNLNRGIRITNVVYNHMQEWKSMRA